MADHSIVSHEVWLAARKALLAKEKEFSRLRDEIGAARQALPWERVETDYRFEGPNGQESLADLFAGRSQLIVYHFMLAPGWGEGCKSCSLLADHFDGAIVHIEQRDVSMAVISIAPLSEIQAFQKRMGWRFKWLSSAGNSFNRDYGVSFTQQELDGGPVHYNYKDQGFPATEAPGLSVFARGEDGAVYHSYSTYARGLDILIGAYNLLDLVPKGRDEGALDFTMAWVRHHDAYGD